MNDSILKIKLDQARGMNLFRFFSVILTFYCVVFSGVRSDTSYISGGSYTERLHTPAAGVTRANIDTSKTRHATADSATITVFKGTKTFRDSTYFAGGLRGLRLYSPFADIDSIYGNLALGGNFSVNGSIIGTAASLMVAPNTIDGSDSKTVALCSGGAGFATRGGFIVLYGNEYSNSDVSGDVSIVAGNSGSVKVTGNTSIDGTVTAAGFSGPVTGNVTGTTGSFSSTLAAATLNTGNGANELYAMNQNVRTTDNVTFNTVSNASGVINRVVDTSGSFACTLKTDCVTVQQIGTVTFRRVGGIVTLKFPKIEGTSNSSLLFLYCGIPLSLNPTGFQRCLLIARDNSSPVMAYATIPNFSTITIARFDGAGFQKTGTKGLALDYMNITYEIN